MQLRPVHTDIVLVYSLLSSWLKRQEINNMVFINLGLRLFPIYG